MKNLILLAIVTTFNVHASLSSPIPSSIAELSIMNSHYVDKSERIIRGMNPLGKVQELLDFGITDVLIFKNQTRTEIDQEYKELASLDKMNMIQTKQIDFLWHDYPSYKETCEQTIDALKYMREIRLDKSRKLFFHCTVGEDRTGYLAGLWRMMTQYWNINSAFYGEMCENGYANGNPNKPDYVVGEIRQDLSPLFMYMADLIKSKKLTLYKLTKKYCTDLLPKTSIKYCRGSSKVEKE